MRTKRFILTFALVATFFSMFALAGCKSTDTEDVDVVGDIPSVNDSFAPSIEEATAQLAAMRTQEDRKAYLDKYYPDLNAGVTYYMRQDGRLTSDQEVDRVEILFGSMRNVAAEQGGSDELRNGHFDDKLVAAVYVRGEQKPRIVILECMNGLSVPIDRAATELQQIASGTPVERFTIAAGEGIAGYHLPYLPSIDLAERWSLPVYKGKRQIDRKRISYADARALASLTDQYQVTVGVVAGDSFDLVADTFERSPLRRSRG